MKINMRVNINGVKRRETSDKEYGMIKNFCNNMKQKKKGVIDGERKGGEWRGGGKWGGDVKVMQHAV